MHYSMTSMEYAILFSNDDLEMVYPKDNEFFIDFDHGKLLPFYSDLCNRMSIFFRELNEKINYNIFIYESKTQGHYHIIIQLPFTLTTPERIALQSIFNSDKNNCLFAFINHKKGDNFPIFFVMKKDRKPINIIELKQQKYF